MARLDVAGRFGLGLLPPSATVAPLGGGALDSDYTEAGPGPGTPVPDDAATRWRPYLVGAQSVALTLATVRGGYPGIDGARVVYRLSGETDPEDFRGWSEPNLPVNWTSPPTTGWGAARTFSQASAVALPNGKVAVLATETGSTDGQSWTYDPQTETWDDGLDWATSSTIDGPVALAYDATTERLLAWTGVGIAGAQTTRAYASTDEGTSWALYSRGPYPVTVAAADEFRVATDPGSSDWLAFVADNHLASSDGGVTFRLVTSGLSLSNALDKYVPLRTSTGWAVIYVDGITDLPTVHLLASPGSVLAASAPITISAATVAGDIAACVDEDGILYVVARGLTATNHILTVYRSVDGGATWAAYSWAPSLGSSSRALNLFSLVAACGQLHLLYGTRGGEATDVNGTVALVTLGGWAQLEHGTGIVSALGPSARMSYGIVAGLLDYGRTWIPFALPENMGWTATTSTGTRTFDGAVPGLDIETTAGAGEVYIYHPAQSANGYTAGHAVLTVKNTSATLTTIGTGNTGVFVSPRLGNAGATILYAPIIDIGRDGIQLRDGATIRATATINTTTAPLHLRWFLRPGFVSVWYRRELFDRPEAWTLLAVDAVVTDSGGADVAGLSWGHGTFSNGLATWRFVGVANGGDFLRGIDNAAQAGLTPADGVRGLRWGRAVPGAGSGGYPLPEATAADGLLGRLVATGGPSPAGPLSIVELPVAYEQGIEHLDPSLSPSPRASWAAFEDGVQTIVYDYVDPAWHGGALALAVLRATVPSVSIEFDNGSGGFGTPVVCSMALVATFNYTLTGKVAVPRAGTTVLDRYVGEGELAGAWALCSTAGTPTFRRVTGNSGGYWSTTSLPAIRLTFAGTGEEGGVDGTEVAAGTGTLYHHSAVHVIYPTSDTARQYVRLTVPAVTGGGVPSAGVIAPFRLVASGAEPDWTWSRTFESSRTLSRAGDGTPSVRRKGPPRWVWSYPWTGGLALGKMRLAATGADYVASASGVPIGVAEDAFHEWVGHIEQGLDQGRLPCLLIPSLPAANATITDPSKYVYGLLASDSVSVTSVVGFEGVDEIIRMDSPVIEEIR